MISGGPHCLVLALVRRQQQQAVVKRTTESSRLSVEAKCLITLPLGPWSLLSPALDLP